jgi:hypothetical protein
MTPGVDTYITAAEADTIISIRLVSVDSRRKAWEALSTADKEVYLREALDWIEGLPLSGRKAVDGQPLQFPRYGQDAVPTAVQAAQALEAAGSVGKPEEIAKRAQLRAMGITSWSAGKISETYGAVSAHSAMNPAAGRLMRPYMLGGVPFD